MTTALVYLLGMASGFALVLIAAAATALWDAFTDPDDIPPWKAYQRLAQKAQDQREPSSPFPRPPDRPTRLPRDAITLLRLHSERDLWTPPGSRRAP